MIYFVVWNGETTIVIVGNFTDLWWFCFWIQWKPWWNNIFSFSYLLGVFIITKWLVKWRGGYMASDPKINWLRIDCLMENNICFVWGSIYCRFDMRICVWWIREAVSWLIEIDRNCCNYLSYNDFRLWTRATMSIWCLEIVIMRRNIGHIGVISIQFYTTISQ